MRRGPGSPSDEELARICTETPLEKVLLVTGCLGIFIAGLLLPLAIAGFLNHAFGKLALAIAAVFLALYLAGLPKRAYREELARRRGRAPFPQYVNEARSQLAQGGADWIVLFKAAHLPHGQFFWLRLTLTEGPPAGAQVSQHISGGKLADISVDGSLPDAALQEVLDMLKGVDLAALTDIPPTVRDGSPCQLAILRREPETVALGSCNLGGLTASRSLLPTVATCLTLADIAHEFSTAQES